jgi:hypothetical protein
MEQRRHPDFADEVTIWHNYDQLGYVLTKEVLEIHNAARTRAPSGRRSARGRRFVCDDAIIELFSMEAKLPDGT